MVWHEALEDFGVEPLHGVAIFASIVDAHGAPDRYYHNLKHLKEMVDFLNPVAEQIERRSEIIFAILFHDFVYEPRGTTNEVQSAAVARTCLSELGISEDVIRRVEALILATKDHDPIPDNRDSRFFLDADMAIFGSHPERYAEYAEGIRNEYGSFEHVPYCERRAGVIFGFLERDPLFLEGSFYPELLQKAKRNIAAEIALLKRSQSKSEINWRELVA
jgi:predicted metal-dependent HD superfamily phosphohydrolase